MEGDLDEPATLHGAMAVRHGGRPRLLPFAMLGLLGLCVPPAAPSAQGYAMDMHIMPMMTEHADISTGNRQRLWPNRPHPPYRLCLAVPDGSTSCRRPAAARYVNECVLELSEFKCLDEPTTTSSPLIYNVRE